MLDIRIEIQDHSEELCRGFPSKCRRTAGALRAPQRWVQCTLLFKWQTHPCDGWSSVWWLCFSSFLNSSPCSAQTQCHIQTVLPFPMFLHDFPLLLFPALLNGLFGVSSSTPNHPSLHSSNIVLTEVTSVKQKGACWHFTKPCARPSICFKQGLRPAQTVELDSCSCTCLIDGIGQYWSVPGAYLWFISR